MKTTSYYRLGVTIGGIAIFIAGIFCCSYDVEHIIIGMAVALLIALTNFSTRLLSKEATLTHFIALGIGIFYSFSLSFWVITLGIVGKTFFQRKKSLPTPKFKWKEEWVLNMGFLVGVNLIPLAFVGLLSQWNSNLLNYSTSNPFSLGTAWLILLGFAGIHISLYVADYYDQKKPKSKVYHRDITSLILLNFIPSPFITLTIQSNLRPIVSISLLTGTIITLDFLTSRFNKIRTQADRQVEELATLDHVSRALQSTLGLNELLPVIHQQVTKFLEIDNFYVALYDQDKNEVWYPLAVKHNQRKNWPRRVMENRLTDRVIQERKPILLTPKNQRGADYIGIPPSAETPHAWMGVPLLTSERTLGCLAVMSFDKNVNFSTDNLNLLSTLSGQVSVAIENTLLYEDIQNRASQLKKLNDLFQSVTASLNIDHVLSQICAGVQQIVGSDKSTVYLLSEDQSTMTLSAAQGLSAKFQKHYHNFSTTLQGDKEIVNLEKVEVIPNISETAFPDKNRIFFEEEGIKALANFPLETIEGQIGFLQIYFDTVQSFPPQQLNLLLNFASQASLAISNARLYANTDQALARRVQQLAILEKIGRELSAELDLERLFTLILQFALKFTDGTVGAVAIYDKHKNSLEFKVSQGYATTYEGNIIEIGIVGRVARTLKAQNVSDIRLDEDYYEIHDGTTRSQLSVPILHKDRLLGIINLESPQLAAFSESEQNFISQLAAQAAIAMVNAELYQEVQERLNEQILLYQFGMQITGTLDFQPLLETILDAMSNILRPVAAGIYQWNPEEELYRIPPGIKLDKESKKHLPKQLFQEQTKKLASQKNISERKLASSTKNQPIGFYLSTSRQPLAFALFYVPNMRNISSQEHKLLETMAIQGAITLQSAHLFSNATWERDRLDTVLDSVDETILMINKEGRILLANDHFYPLTGTKPSKIIGTHFAELPATAQTALGLSDTKTTPLEEIYTETDTSWPLKEIYTIKKPNSERIIERGIFPIGGDQQDVQGRVIVLRDITEEIHIQQERELISETLVHDLRSPTSAILGALALMEDILPKENNDNILSQSLKVAQRSTKRVLQMIRSLLDISRLASGSLELVLDLTNIHDVLNTIIIEFVPQANQAGIILQNEIGSDLPKLWIDTDKIERVISNLIDNAIKFTPEGGKVTLSATTLEEDKLLFQVKDTGPGVPLEYREKIFERFAQVPGTRGRRRGSGLGLTFCSLAVEAHEGKIWVETNQEGGSIFNFTLPLEGPETNEELIYRRSYLAKEE